MGKSILISALALAAAWGCSQPATTPTNAAKKAGVETAGEQKAAAKPTISDAWIAATADGVKVSAGYMTISNPSATADRLVSASMPKAGVTELHVMANENGAMKMRTAEGGVEVGANSQVSFAPGGTHIMFLELKETLKEGATAPVTLTFEKAGTVTVDFAIKPRAAMSKGHDHK